MSLEYVHGMMCSWASTPLQLYAIPRHLVMVTHLQQRLVLHSCTRKTVCREAQGAGSTSSALLAAQTAHNSCVTLTHLAAGLPAAEAGGEGAGRGLAPAPPAGNPGEGEGLAPAPPAGSPGEGLAPGTGAAGLGPYTNDITSLACRSLHSMCVSLIPHESLHADCAAVPNKCLAASQQYAGACAGSEQC